MRAPLARSYARVRWAARAPRLVALALAAVLGAAGLRAALAPPDSPRLVIRHQAGGGLAAQGFAQSFARAYLSWDARRPGERERRLAGMVSTALDPGAGYAPPESGSERVRWTAAVGDQPGALGRTVLVAVETSRRLVHLAVPVARDERGRLVVAHYPALVGGPAAAPDVEQPAGHEVADGELRAVVARALGNYLEGEASNLRADLAPGAEVSLPDAPLGLRSVEEITEAGPGRVAALALAEERGGGQLTLRYELRVVRRDRWYVRSIAINPIEGGSG